jgi:copper oxidase (laccase) domain-containing protein
VGKDLIDQVERAFGLDAAGLLINHSGNIHFDLWKANSLVLEKAGVEKIQIAGICSACNTQDWFSHRAEHGRAGRYGAILAMSK